MYLQKARSEGNGDLGAFPEEQDTVGAALVEY